MLFDAGVLVLKRPMVVAPAGQNTTRPSGRRTPPIYAELGIPLAVVVYVFVTGLKRPTKVAACGTKTTRPSGRRTPPIYAVVAIALAVVVYAFVAGLKMPM